MVRYLSLLSILTFISGTTVYPQSAGRTVSGLVISQEESTPLPDVLVYVKGTNNRSGTQQDGMFYIDVTDRDSILVFQLDEFQTREVKLTQANDYNIALGRGKPQPKENAPFSPLGSWRAVFELTPGVTVPVNFDIRTTTAGNEEAFFRNADEEFDGGRVKVTADSLFIFLDQFDNELAFRVGDTILTGEFRHQDKTGPPLPVRAERGITSRFPETGQAPAGDLSGTYDIGFISGNGKEEKAVGHFRQDGNKLSATFLRVTGDSRYLEGIVEGNDFYLSSFIGGIPAYFKGSFTPDGRLTGQSVSARGALSFAGTLNAKAGLPDPYKLTGLKEGYSGLDFSFPDVNGQKISPKDERFKNKVVIVAIGGTWCPNCVDEASFLAPWYKANRERGVEIISIQYERQSDPDFVKKVLTRMRSKYDIQYDQVFGGIADQQGVANSLPALNTFLAFPTTILIDRKGRVAKIHTGYSGPATGIYYQQFVKEFNEEIDLLLKG